MATTVNREALGIAQSVRKLPSTDQQRVLRLVELMLVARNEARLQAQLMIRETWPEGLDERDQCVAFVDATIRYLEQHTDASRLI